MDIACHPELVHPTAYVAPNAVIVGEVRIGAEASVWFGCVLRGDNAPITVGARANVQDLTVIHTDVGVPCTLGEGVTVGHRAVLHGVTVEDGALIGIGAIVLNGAVVGREALVGAGAVVAERMSIPPRHLALGVPARVVRELEAEEIERLHTDAAHYVARARAFLVAESDRQIRPTVGIRRIAMSVTELLQRSGLFVELTPEMVEQIAALGQEVVYDAGDVVISEGDPSDEIYVICEGMVEVEVARDALSDVPGPPQSSSIVHLGQGQTFGEMALVDRGARSATVRCVQDGTVLHVIPRENFWALCNSDHNIGFIVMRNIAFDLSFKLRHRNLQVGLAGGGV